MSASIVEPLRSSGLGTVLLVRANISEAAVQINAPIVSSYSQTAVVGVVSAGDEAARWRSLQPQLEEACPEIECSVRIQRAWTRGDGKQLDQRVGNQATLRESVRSYSRCTNGRSVDTQLPSHREVASLASALAEATAGGSNLSLTLVALVEHWVHGGTDAAIHHTCLQLEGFAPESLQQAVQAAATRFLESTASAQLTALGPLEMNAVCWYPTVDQGALVALRWHAAYQAGQPPPQDPPSWLAASEALCARAPGGLIGVIKRAMAPSPRQLPRSTTPSPLPAHVDHEWREGRTVLSAADPRIELYPNFLSGSECDHLLTLALARAQQPANASVFLVPKWRAAIPTGDAVAAAIEERCALATGVPCHTDEVWIVCMPSTPPHSHTPLPRSPQHPATHPHFPPTLSTHPRAATPSLPHG